MDHHEEALDYDMQCTNPITLFKGLDRNKYPDGLTVPCGRCLACRISKRREWTIRMIHELSSHDNAIFVTLTYSDDTLPANASLCKHDLQKFFKRVRKQLSHNSRNIRYFSCGEYGDETNRPHYHAIIFGMSLNAEDKQLIKDCWTLGHIDFGTAEPDSMRYVAQYIDKKYSGDMATEEYDNKGREPVFRIMSLGLGRGYLTENKQQLYDNMYVTINGIPVALPRYYLTKLDIPEDLSHRKAIEAEIDLVERKSGHRLTRLEYYKTMPVSDVVKLEEQIGNSKKQYDKNLKAKSKLRSRSKI